MNTRRLPARHAGPSYRVYGRHCHGAYTWLKPMPLLVELFSCSTFEGLPLHTPAGQARALQVWGRAGWREAPLPVLTTTTDCTSNMRSKGVYLPCFNTALTAVPSERAWSQKQRYTAMVAGAAAATALPASPRVSPRNTGR